MTTCSISYDKGDNVRLSAAFTSGGVPSDPTIVILKVKQPDGTIDTYTYALAEITRLSTGNYYKDVIMTQVGQLWYHYAGSGALASSEEKSLVVGPSEFD